MTHFVSEQNKCTISKKMGLLWRNKWFLLLQIETWAQGVLSSSFDIGQELEILTELLEEKKEGEDFAVPDGCFPSKT